MPLYKILIYKEGGEKRKRREIWNLMGFLVIIRNLSTVDMPPDLSTGGHGRLGLEFLRRGRRYSGQFGDKRLTPESTAIESVIYSD